MGQTLQNGRFRPDRGVPFSGRKLQSALASIGSSFGINARQSVDTIKGRISYLFSIH